LDAAEASAGAVLEALATWGAGGLWLADWEGFTGSLTNVQASSGSYGLGTQIAAVVAKLRTRVDCLAITIRGLLTGWATS
jgi:hypothetical protein